MRRLSAAIGRPVTFALLQVDDAPDLWRELMDESLRAVRRGSRPVAPGGRRAPPGCCPATSPPTACSTDIPAYQELQGPGPAAPRSSSTALRDPEVRDAIVSWEPDVADQRGRAWSRPTGRTFVLGNPPDYEPGPERSLAGIAAATRASPPRGRLRRHARGRRAGAALRPHPQLRHGDLDPVREMLLHPRAAAGLGDGGAHCGVICDAVQPTFMLTHWTRDRTRGERLPLEWVVKKQTHDTARLYGLSDRGTVEPGALADLNLIDYERLQLGAPNVVADLPAGGSRLLQDATGYVDTIKSGDHLRPRRGDRRAARAPGARRPLSEARRRTPARQTAIPMASPLTEYALRDGVHVGYQVWGSGPGDAPSTCSSSAAA